MSHEFNWVCYDMSHLMVDSYTRAHYFWDPGEKDCCFFSIILAVYNISHRKVVVSR